MENINLSVQIEVLVKGVNLMVYSKKDNGDYISIKIGNVSNKIIMNKDKFDMEIDVKEIFINTKRCD